MTDTISADLHQTGLGRICIKGHRYTGVSCNVCYRASQIGIVPPVYVDRYKKITDSDDISSSNHGDTVQKWHT